MRTIGLVVALTAVAGCKSGLPKMPDLSEVTPKARFQELKVKDIDFERLDGRFVLEVDNPYPLDLDFSSSSWKLGLAGHPFLDGVNDENVVIAPSDTSVVRIPFTMGFVDALKVAADVADASDTLPYSFDVDFAFKTPIGPVTVPVHHEGDMPALRAPNVALRALRIEKLDILKNKASLALDLNLHSDQPSALSFDTFAWGVKLAGSDVASGSTAIGPVDGDKLVSLPIDLNLLGIGEAIVNALTKKSPLKVRLKADASVGTPFGAIPLSVDEVADLTPR